MSESIRRAWLPFMDADVPADRAAPVEVAAFELELAAKYLVEDGGVVAVDLAGAEAIYPTENYRELFQELRQYRKEHPIYQK